LRLPAVEPPAGHRMTDFLYRVALAYALAALKGLSQGLPPARAIAGQAGLSRRGVHKWVYTARKRGIMPAARGRVGSHRWRPTEVMTGGPENNLALGAGVWSVTPISHDLLHTHGAGSGYVDI
jgi:hypothetical protein